MSSSQQSEKMLQGFPLAGYDEWKAQVVKQLKGGDFDKLLYTATAEGITLKPLYHPQDPADARPEAAPPGQFPYTRGRRASGAKLGGWAFGMNYDYPDATRLNQALAQDLSKGVKCALIELDQAAKQAQPASLGQSGKQGLALATKADFEQALQGLDLAQTEIILSAGQSGPAALAQWVAAAGQTQLKGALLLDPFASLAAQGSLAGSLDAFYDQAAQLVTWAGQKQPGFQVLGLDLRPYAEAGGSAVSELAAALASGVALIKALLQRGLALEAILAQVRLVFGVGPQYFMEVAKFRAARCLWAQMAKAFGASDQAAGVQLYASPLLWNKSVFDPHVNMLRVTTEVFSAVVGGCDGVSSLPFDATLGLSSLTARRWARNLHVLLKEESHVHEVVDPAGGSWLVESLTDELGEKAWGLFQSFEAAGGMLAALEQGLVQAAVAEAAAGKLGRLENQKYNLVGSNRFANIQESLPQVEQWQPEAAFAAAQKAEQAASAQAASGQWADLLQAAQAGASLKTLNQASHQGQGPKLKALSIRRALEGFEQLRFAALDYKAKKGQFPVAYLIKLGSLGQHAGRADFASTFLQAGGFQIQSGPAAMSAQEAIQPALDSGAQLLVICSSDDNYKEMAPALAQGIKAQNSKLHLVLAGYPKDQLETLTQAGVDAFLHLKSNHLEALQSFQQKAGVV